MLLRRGRALAYTIREAGEPGLMLSAGCRDPDPRIFNVVRSPEAENGKQLRLQNKMLSVSTHIVVSG